MNSLKKFFFGVVAFFLLLQLAFASGAAGTQQNSSSATLLRIGGFDVEQVRELAGGTELKFILYGTPGGIAVIRISGAAGRLFLEEVETGLYEGAYTIKTRDSVTAGSRITASLRLGDQVVSVVLDEALIATAPMTSARRMAEAASSSTDPRIDRFDVIPNQLVSGSDLIFTLYGTSGAIANIRIAGVAGRVILQETRDGVYEGTYTIKTRDRIAPDSRVMAHMRLGGHRSSAILGKTLQADAYEPDPGAGARVENGAPLRDQ
jgi:hypothetical protein